MQDWGGPMGGVVSSRYPDRMKRFVAMNPIFGTDRNVREERLTPWFSAIKAMEDAGQLEAVLGNLRYLVGGVVMTLGLQRREGVTNTRMRAYESAFTTLEKCRSAIAFTLTAPHPELITRALLPPLPTH